MDPSIRQLLMRLQRLRVQSADGNAIQSFINLNYSILTLHLKCFSILFINLFDEQPKNYTFPSL